MSEWWRRWTRRGQEQPAASTSDEARELLDAYHSRASLRDGDRILLNPGQVLENIREAMERLDLDINTAISIEEDVVTLDELLAMIEHMRMGPVGVRGARGQYRCGDHAAPLPG